MKATTAAPVARPRAYPSTLVVEGGHDLSGTAHVAGFKHAMVVAFAASCLGRAPVRLGNCPDITETGVLAELARRLGAVVEESDGVLTVDASSMTNGDLDRGLVASGHGPAYLAPAVLARFGRVVMPPGGGCAIGDGDGGRRPSRHYAEVLERFGAATSVRADGSFEARAATLRACEIDLLDFAHDRVDPGGPYYSGATKMALLTAAVARGTTVLRNPYRKADTACLADVLRRMGADVEDDGSRIVVRGAGAESLTREAGVTLLPDLIELTTWICVGATTCPDGLTVAAPDMETAARALEAELDALASMGVAADLSAGTIEVRRAAPLRPIDLVVRAHGVFSDNHPLFALLAASADGCSTIEDTVWRRRFGYVEGLARLGVRITRNGSSVRIAGPCPPRLGGSTVAATDLRAAAVLLLAALQVPGTTTITGCEHLGRGYPDLPGALVRLGARIESV